MLRLASQHAVGFGGLLFAALLCGAAATAAPVHVQVVDALSGAPVPGAVAVNEATGARAVADAEGWVALDVDVAGGETVAVSADGVVDDTTLRWGRLDPSRPVRIFAGDAASPGGSWGAPLAHRPDDGVEPSPIDLPGAAWSPLRLVHPGRLPDTIRVGRRFAESCSSGPVREIEEVELEDYVQGVLIPEIGVFQRIAGGPDSAESVFRAFAVAARSYAVWWYYRDPGAPYHVDDTACNQRYESARSPWVAAQVAATRGEVLVQATNPTLLHKYEYAASCGRNGSRPMYQESLVPDLPGSRACVGSWCGHDACAGHETNPALPDSGRCLVRGICQWGAAERSIDGATYDEILAHYQPNLAVVRLSEVETTRLVGFVRDGDVYTGAAIVGARVTTGGATVETDARGFFAFEPPPITGAVEVRADAAGYISGARGVVVAPSVTTWSSLALRPAPGEDAGDADDAGDVDGAGDSGTAGNDEADEAGDDDAGDESSDDAADEGDEPEDGSAIDADDGLDAPLSDAQFADVVPDDRDTGVRRDAGSSAVDDARGSQRGCAVAAASAPRAWAALALVAVTLRRRRGVGQRMCA